MDAVEKFNLKPVQNPGDLKKIAENDIGDRAVRLMLTGYSAAPAGYAGKTQAFVEALVQQLGASRTALITSPTADKGSIDAIGTLVAQSSGAKVMYITSQNYVGYIDPAKFPAGIDEGAYIAKEKYVLPDSASYSVASTVAANAILVTGGRDTAVLDTVNSLTRGNRILLAEGLTDMSAWDPAKGRVNNAVSYIREQLQSLQEKGILKYEVRGGLTKELLAEHKGKFLFVTTAEEAVRALRQTGKAPAATVQRKFSP